MADLNGHAAGNGGHSQGTPTAHRALLYSDIDANAVYQDLDFVWDSPGNIIRHWLMPKRGRIMGTC